MSRVKAHFQKVAEGKDSDMVTLPQDCQLYIENAAAKEWLDKYGISNSMRVDFDVTWSPAMQAVIFPLYDQKGEVFAYLSRNFVVGKPKWTTTGSPHACPLIYPTSKLGFEGTCVVVEDVVSAIKVSEMVDTMPLMGTHLNHDRAVVLTSLYRNIVIWLDNDAIKQAMGHVRLLQQVAPGVEVYVLQTTGDPKDHSLEEIYDLLYSTVGDDASGDSAAAHDTEDGLGLGC